MPPDTLADANDSAPLPPSALSDSIFSCREGVIHKDYVGDTIAELKRLNKDRIDEGDASRGEFLLRSTVQTIFTLCARLRCPVEIRFTSCAVFDNFMRLHSRQMLAFLMKLKMPQAKLKEEWEKVETNLSRQLMLRICSSIQIATKYSSYHESLSTKQICAVLRNLSTPYTVQATFKSELRILKALDYKFPITPLAYAESLLKTLALTRSGKSLDVDDIWALACVLLDIVYLEREVVYERMITTLIGGNTDVRVSRSDMVRLQSDWMHLGCAIVTAAAVCHYGYEIATPIARELEVISGTPAQDTTELCIAILEVSRDAWRKEGETTATTSDNKGGPPRTPPNQAHHIVPTAGINSPSEFANIFGGAFSTPPRSSQLGKRRISDREEALRCQVVSKFPRRNAQ